MEERRNYSIRKNRYKKSFLLGFSINGDSRIDCISESFEHCCILDRIDGVEEDSHWGRLKFECDFEKDTIYTVYVFATNSERLIINGKEIMIAGKKFINQNDVLLYDVQGRFLYVMLVVNGYGKGYIDNFCIDNQGDFYMESLPEVYKDYGSFFHRYLSVFSSLYMDLEKKIENAEEIFDLDKAPVNVLTIFGKWLGIDVSGDFLSEDKLRLLIKEAYSLNRMKGTRKALERLTEIVLGEKTIILEKNQLYEDERNKENYEFLYGKGKYDVTILIKSYVPENQKSQLEFLIKQFVPIRCSLNIRFLDECNGLGDHLYMDINTRITENPTGELDVRQVMDGTILLKD